MPALANIVLADGQTTPANHTFTVASLQDNRGVYYDRSKSTQAEQPYLTLQFVQGRKSSDVSRVKGSIVVPLYDSTAGRVINTVPGSFEVIIPGSSTQQQRDDIAAYMKNLLAHATVQAMIKSPEGVY